METLVAIYANNPNVPHNTLQPEITRLNSAFIAFTNTIIIVRILVRARIVKHVALEDHLMVAAGVVATAFSAMNIVGMCAMLTPTHWTDLARNTIWSWSPHIRFASGNTAGKCQEGDTKFMG